MPKKSAADRRYNHDALDEAARKRSQHASIRRYLEALDWREVPRGRPADPSQVQERLDTVLQQLVAANPLTRVMLIQERMNLEAELAAITGEDAEPFEALEAAFIEHAADWAARKQVTYAALRESGVPARVLRLAGIARR